jgi:hypothetical protein
VSIWAIFRRDRPVLQVATCLPDATTEMLIDAPVQPAHCRELTAAGHLAPCAGAGDVLMGRSRQVDMITHRARESRGGSFEDRAHGLPQEFIVEEKLQEKLPAGDGWLRGDGACVTS